MHARQTCVLLSSAQLSSAQLSSAQQRIRISRSTDECDEEREHAGQQHLCHGGRCADET